jgi:LCP family protein required for cell wall assembly
MGETPSRPPRASRPGTSRGATAFLVAAGILSLLIAAGSGFSIATIQRVEGSLVKYPVPDVDDPDGSECTETNCLTAVSPKCVRKACNFLILGSDSREGFRRGPVQAEGQRADTIMLVQVDADIGRTVVLSIPRDLRVDIPGHGQNKINTAFGHGPDVMVRTVERLTGLNVNHYVQVNFLGFQRLVDALGGVPICINKPMVDTLAKLNLPRPGCYTLHGEQALAFVRARHIEGDAIPDFSRISRQQQFLRALLDKVLSVGAITRLPDFLRAAEENLVLDENLNLYALQDLTIELAKVGQKGVEFRVVPSVPLQVDQVDYLQLVQPQASTLFRRMLEGKRLGTIGRAATLTPISPANITIRLFDADSGGKVDEVAEYLGQAGFVVPEVEVAPVDFTDSVILWSSGAGTEKEVVWSYFPDLSVEFSARHLERGEIAVVVGADFKGIEGL